MDSVSGGLTAEMWVSVGVLVLAYLLIFTEVIHRSGAAIIGAVVMVAVGMFFDFYSQEDALKAIDANTLLLLMGMMVMVVVLRPTGGFEYVAIKIAKWAGHSQYALLVSLCLAVSVISMFLDNVTTVLIFAPLTMVITRILAVNPLPYLMSEAMLSNVGGIATLVGDPPNVMIGSVSGIDFLSFLTHMGPMVAIIWVVITGLILFIFKDYLSKKPTGKVDLNENEAITDPVTLVKGLFALVIVIALFFIHHYFYLYPAYVALIGVAIAFALVDPEPEAMFGKVEWSVLAFFSGLFVIVGGVEHSGLLNKIGMVLAESAREESKLLMACILLMWVAAIASAIVDNIPFTVTMLPIVQGLESQGINVTPLWWALALGVGLGGNGSHIGATANVICVAQSEKAGDPAARITPMIWLKKGMPIMLVSLVVASAGFMVAFDYFR